MDCWREGRAQRGKLFTFSHHLSQVCFFSRGRFENKLRKNQTWSDVWLWTFFRKRTLLGNEMLIHVFIFVLFSISFFSNWKEKSYLLPEKYTWKVKRRCKVVPKRPVCVSIRNSVCNCMLYVEDDIRMLASERSHGMRTNVWGEQIRNMNGSDIYKSTPLLVNQKPAEILTTIFDFVPFWCKGSQFFKIYSKCNRFQ